MKKKIGVLLIRGAGKADSSSDREKFVGQLNKQLLKNSINPQEIHYEFVNWYAPTQVNEDLLLKRFFSSDYKIRARKLREFIINLVSDIVAYVGEPNKKSTAYEQTHALIYSSVKTIENEVEPGAPIILLASSLGTEIISNYIWDRQNPAAPDPFGKTAMQRLETLTAIFMLGNNNALYLSAYPIDSVMPFQFPPENLKEKFKRISYWGNFYDKNDPLGFPLKPINPFFDAMVSEDVQLSVGGILFSWNPASHLAYWKSRRIRNQITKYIVRLFKIIEGA
jgi:hypothetical protein